MRSDTHPVASGTGDGTRICWCGKGLLVLVEGTGASVFAQRALPGAAAPPAELCSPEIGAGWERKAARALARVRLGGKLPPGKWEPDTLGGTGASCCFPFSNMQVCKILMWSHLRKQINPFICVASFPQLMPTVVLLPEGAPGLAHTDFFLSFRIPVVMLLDACQWLMIKYS